MMNNSFNISVESTIPKVKKIKSKLGIPDNVEPDKQTLECIEDAIKKYQDCAKPMGLYKELSNDEFDSIFIGDNLNEHKAPLENIYKNSEQLALFVVTVGIDVCKMITELFEENDFAVATILDVVASSAAEKTEKELIKKYLDSSKNKKLNASQSILPFSPGYCGWHITSQRKLFKQLEPEKIGVSINKSCLMNPLKSISGVLVTGNKEIFEIYPDYPFCKDCKSQSCVERTSKILNS